MTKGRPLAMQPLGTDVGRAGDGPGWPTCLVIAARSRVKKEHAIKGGEVG